MRLRPSGRMAFLDFSERDEPPKCVLLRCVMLCVMLARVPHVSSSKLHWPMRSRERGLWCSVVLAVFSRCGVCVNGVSCGETGVSHSVSQSDASRWARLFGRGNEEAEAGRRRSTFGDRGITRGLG